MVVDVKLEKVTKRFGKTVAVESVDLFVRKGELFGIIGPSGCGKTTTLRLIAGLEYPDDGRIFFGDKDVTFTKPYERNVAMVFQNYALWPHMTVYENIAYGLKLRKIPQMEIKQRIRRVLELTKLEGLESRYPTQLSGGQQQRVALARALVVEPDVLLLDEPLSNLDAKLRVEMRSELKNIVKKTDITTIYVTHDQEEAMNICDRIALMNNGKVVQIGEPKELYFNPKSFFVATFMGKSNVLEGKVVSIQPTIVAIDNLTLYVDKKLGESLLNKKVYIVIRPENIKLVDFTTYDDKSKNILEGIVTSVSFLGSHYMITLDVGEKNLNVLSNVTEEIRQGHRLKIYIPPNNIMIFDNYD